MFIVCKLWFSLPPHFAKSGSIFRVSESFPHLKCGSNSSGGICSKPRHSRRADLSHRLSAGAGVSQRPSICRDSPLNPQAKRAKLLSCSQESTVSIDCAAGVALEICWRDAISRSDDDISI